MDPLTFDSDDVGLVEATVSQLYSKMNIGAVGSTTRARITRRVVAPELGFDDLDYSFDIGYAAEAQPFMILCEVVTSTIRRFGEGHDETFGPGDLFLISRPELPYAGVAHAPRLRFTILDPALLARVAGTVQDQAADKVQVLDHRPISRQAALELQRAIAYVRGTVLASPEAKRAPLVVSTAAQHLAAAVLHAFPNSATATMVVSESDTNPGALRRAIAFIEANPDLDISLSDIAGAASVTPRAVQLAFRRHLDTTPLAYLRRVRLDHANKDLQNATSNDDVTVTDISYRWGFASPSRFAQLYRTAYGTTPSATLRQ